MEPNQPLNLPLWKHFFQLGASYKDLGEIGRSKAFSKVADIIALFPEVITSSSQLQGIKNVGKSSLQEIDEFLKKNTSTRYLAVSPAEEELLFQDVYGIGRKNSAKFYQQGIRSLQQLAASPNLNDKQKIGLKYYYDFKQRIPREEIDELGRRLVAILPNHRNNHPAWYIAGSYRRGESSSGDIDILARWVTMDQFLSSLNQVCILQETLAKGPSKFMGVVKVWENTPSRRLDIRIVNEDQFIYALMYFTGSKKFNILMRNRAIQFGGKLNEYQLQDQQGRLYPVVNEQQIFDLLQVKYLSPEERTPYLKELPLLS